MFPIPVGNSISVFSYTPVKVGQLNSLIRYCFIGISPMAVFRNPVGVLEIAQG